MPINICIDDIAFFLNDIGTFETKIISETKEPPHNAEQELRVSVQDFKVPVSSMPLHIGRGL